MRRLEEYIPVGQKRLRCGYTTGTCAAAATRAAAELLLAGKTVPLVRIQTPAGIEVPVEVEEAEHGPCWAQCAVRKDAGDDPDATDGALVRARVEHCGEPGIHVEGGEGVGRVTRAGLDQPVGAAAINSVPRRMIAEQVEAVLQAVRSGGEGRGSMLRQSCFGESTTGAFASCGTARGASPLAPRATFSPLESENSGLRVTVSVPGGEEIARRTFNPRMGIEGGISIIGTSGIVRPMSEEAAVASIELEMNMLAAAGTRDVLVVPGNYGRDFARDALGLDVGRAVQCSNYFGATLDAAVRLGFARMLLVGHLGKMAKVAGGIMNTHSRVADCRMEVMAAHASLAGAPQRAIRDIMEAATTDAALDVLAECGHIEAAMASFMDALARRLSHRAGDKLQVEAVVFSRKRGLLGETAGARQLARAFGAPAAKGGME